MKVTITLPVIQGHEQECAQIAELAKGELVATVREWTSSHDFEEWGEYENANTTHHLAMLLADLGIALFSEKRFNEAEAVFLSALDNKLDTQPTLDRLIKIYVEKRQPEKLEMLLRTEGIRRYEYQGENYLADRIRAHLVELPYLKKADEIEAKWQELNDGGFLRRASDEVWALCIQGRELFWVMAEKQKAAGEALPKTIPSYRRAVMLLEHEKRWREAIRLCEEAIQWGIPTNWYSKRIGALTKKLGRAGGGAFDGLPGAERYLRSPGVDSEGR